MERKTLMLIFLPAVLLFILILALEKNVTVNRGKAIESAQRSAPVHEEYSASIDATRALRYVADARMYVRRKEIDSALHSLKEAENLITGIQNSLPTMKARERIAVIRRHLEYEDPKDVSHEIVFLYGSLEEIKDLVPVEEAERYLKLARKALRHGDSKGAEKALDEARNSLLYTEIGLPLSRAKNNLRAAEQSLSHGKALEADESLRSAEKNLEFVSVESSNPIKKGRRSLWCATVNYTAGRYQIAKKDLEKAEKYLREAIEGGDRKVKEEAKKLEKEVHDLKNSVHETTQTTTSRLSSLFERFEALAEREAERIYSDWQSMRLKSNVRADLVEARLHVTYAESYLITLGDLSKAREDLEICNAYLDRALKNAEPEIRAKISELKRTIAGIKAYGNLHSKRAKKKFEKIESDIRDLIESLEE